MLWPKLGLLSVLSLVAGTGREKGNLQGKDLLHQE